MVVVWTKRAKRGELFSHHKLLILTICNQNYTDKVMWNDRACNIDYTFTRSIFFCFTFCIVLRYSVVKVERLLIELKMSKIREMINFYYIYFF